MQIGFALLEVGSVQSKNAKSILVKNLLDASVGTLAWWVFGYGLAYGGGADSAVIMGTSEFFTSDYQDPNYLWFVFQWAFATTAATIVSGSVAERCNPTAYLIFSLFVTAFFYPIAVHWIWSENAWLFDLGFRDYAGCAPVHMLGGISGLTGAFILGPRTGRFDLKGNPNPMPAHNLVLSTIGALILWFGWYGFNGGSVGRLTNGGIDIAAKSFVTTTISTAGAGLLVYWIESYLSGVRDLPPLLNGILAGLVSITAGADCVDTYAAFIIGVIGAFTYCMGYRYVLRQGIDDPLNAFALHGLCGVWGILAVGIFANGDNGGTTGLLYGNPMQIVWQLLGAIVVSVWSAVTSYICFQGIDYCVGLRVFLSEEKVSRIESRSMSCSILFLTSSPFAARNGRNPSRRLRLP